MESEGKTSDEEFRETLNKIDNFCHVKEFKSLSETKIYHLRDQKHNQPSDIITQMRRLVLHVIYLYYVGYVKKRDIYIYQHDCITKWGLIFRYFSLSPKSKGFMKQVRYFQFQKNIKQIFAHVWKFKKKEEKDLEEKENLQSDTYITKSYWREFANQFYLMYQNLEEFGTPELMMRKIQTTNHMKNNILILAVLSSTILPSVKLNKSLYQLFLIICKKEPLIMAKIFTEDSSSQGKRQFVSQVAKFLNELSNQKVLSVTTTPSEELPANVLDGESLLVEFGLKMERQALKQDQLPQNNQISESKLQSSNNQKDQDKSKYNSEFDFYQGSEEKDLSQIKCNIFWSQKKQSMQLSFRITIFINKRIYPLQYREVECIWIKLSQKWKANLDKAKELYDFNPNFISLDYSKEAYQISLTENIRCQPIQSVLTQLIITTDKLIIAALAMKDVFCYYQTKNFTININKEELAINPGRMEDLAKSICQCICNYYRYSQQIKLQIFKESNL